jgi:ATPase family associated with various cellular activities (AAA)
MIRPTDGVRPLCSEVPVSSDPTTFNGALAILGHHDRPWLEKVGNLLGVTLLAGGAVAGVAAVGPAVPAAAFGAALWGWTDQKHEALDLLNDALGKVAALRSKTKGVERHKLILAAHSALVAASLFEVLCELLSSDDYGKVAGSLSRRQDLLRDRDSALVQSTVNPIFDSSIPSPSSTAGFHENISLISSWAEERIDRLHGLLAEDAGQPSAEEETWSAEDLLSRMAERYQTRFLTMAATVPEFRIWTELGEHAATRHEVALALQRVVELLPPSAAISGTRTQHEIVSRANQSELTRPVISDEQMGEGDGLTFPSVENIYIDPRCRAISYDRHSSPSGRYWWQQSQVHDDVAARLLAHVTSAAATIRPLLLLGDPGCGKSLLTKVFAARLAPQDYVVVRVPLRNVQAHAPVYQQISQALMHFTQGRVTDWATLADESAGDAMRVVLLDGLDELLQAAGHKQNYLTEVAEFQRSESAQGRPVVVIVTARIVVADRIDIPVGTSLIKLEEFDDDQIAEWLRVWNKHNAEAIDAGRIRGLLPEQAARYPTLTTQPLLLLMLAIYVALTVDRSSTATTDISSTSLYHQLLRMFAKREAARKSATEEEELREVDEILWRLSVAAFAMLNRGAQQVSDVHLGNDLMALSRSDAITRRPEVEGQHLLGQFFFVHTSEAHAGAVDSTLRVYEFLHATFAEYLIAERILLTLDDVSDAAFGGRYTRQPEDSLLYALLSHQPHLTNPRIVEFARELFAGYNSSNQERMRKTLDDLLARHRRRPTQNLYLDYKPMPATEHVRELAAYSCNLVLLRVLLEPKGTATPISVLLPDPRGEDDAAWFSMVDLWRSGLDPDGFLAVHSAIAREDDALIERVDGLNHDATDSSEITRAELATNDDMGELIRDGLAIRGKLAYRAAISWETDNRRFILTYLFEPMALELIFRVMTPEPETTLAEVSTIGRLLALAIQKEATEDRASGISLDQMVTSAEEFGLDNLGDVYPLVRAAIANPAILDKRPWVLDALRQDDAKGLRLLSVIDPELGARLSAD